MTHTVWISPLIGFAASSLGGTLLHFLYEWLGEPTWIAPFSGVNESTWEHMKLLFWPMLLVALIGSFFSDRADFWSIKLRSVLLGLLLIPVLFYTYNGAIGKSPDFLNIAIFFVAAAVAYVYEAYALSGKGVSCPHPRLAIAALLAIGVGFVVFTFFPPTLGIFRDPLTGAYGVKF